jgi:predicted small integral membrane protein
VRPVPLFLALVSLGCSAIWAAGAFVTQDGPAHAYTAYRMLGLLKHDPAIGALFAFNSPLLPNSTGHWLLVPLLDVVSPLAANRILATLTYAGLVAAVGLLRFSTSGRDGLATSLLIGAAIGFNWLWLCGLNNFLLGAIGFTFGLGLFHAWRDALTAPRVLALSLLLLFVYFSHAVTFAVLAAGLVLSAAGAAPQSRRRASIGVLAALAPAALLALFFGASVARGALSPAWRRLADPLSIASWLHQIRSADPFVLISRRAFPFSTASSDAFAVFTPLLWLLAAFAFLALGTLAPGARAGWSRGKLAFLAALAGCALAAAFGPDDFGTSHGTLLRERLALLGAVCFVPLFRTAASARTTRIAQACLAFVVLFQTAALWEYALRSDRDAREFLALGAAAGNPESLGSVVVLEDRRRFPSNPTAQMGNLLGIGRRTVVWDNYEVGYDLFPVVARSQADRQFALDFTSSNVFDLQDSPERFAASLAKLDACLADHHGRIGTLLAWSSDPRVDAVLGKWYESEPFFERGRGRLYRRRAEPSAP